jgi:2-polyprenyl-3-methyl-5-hydroxy-6-metoxy-1,4-benzoquinol methylase
MNIMKCAWQVYKKESFSTYLHVLVRAAICPFNDLLPYFPDSGDILDVGCGHGLLPNLLSNDPRNRARRIVGIDHDQHKIAVASRCAGERVRFSTEDLSSLAAASFDAISIVDVLYTIKRDRWKELLGGCFRVLRPGGTVIVKEVINSPRWKYWAIMAEESLAIDILRITKGERPHIESVEAYRDALRESGFSINEGRLLKARNWISHYLFIGRKP